MFRESGIFSELHKRTLNPKNLPVIERKQNMFSNVIKFGLLHFRGLFLLFLIVNSIAILLLCIELIKRKMSLFLLYTCHHLT